MDDRHSNATVVILVVLLVLAVPCLAGVGLLAWWALKIG
jgi:hypothetical protein